VDGVDPAATVPVNLEAPHPVEVVQELLRPFVEDLGRVREELGAERVRREQAERERDDLAAQLAALGEARDTAQTAADVPEGSEPATVVSPMGDIPNPETTAAEPEGSETRPATGSAQESVERRSWWRRWFGFE
jgi:hypothetical protein